MVFNLFRQNKTLPHRTASKVVLWVEHLEDRCLLTGYFQPQILLADPMDGTFSPQATASPTGLTPAQVRRAYGFDQFSFGGGVIPADGEGTTIAIVNAFNHPNIEHDLREFSRQFDLPEANLTIVNQTGGTDLPAADSGWAMEIALDVQWAHAIAPKADILLVLAEDNTFLNLNEAVLYAAQQPGVVAVSMSFGAVEFAGETLFNLIYQTPAGHDGVTFVAASGDFGAPPIYPSISPNVLSVGGTTLNVDAVGNVSSETGWSGSGGGISSFESQPVYQQGVVTQSTTMRTSPDISYDANPNTGFPVYDTFNNPPAAPWSQFGGTSAGAPQWAALLAIANQGRALHGLSSLDGVSQTLPMLYSLPAANFRDITTGTSTGTPNHTASPGYDLVTGRGSPIANFLVPNLIGPMVMSTTPNVGSAVVIEPTSFDVSFSFVVDPASLQADDFLVSSGIGSLGIPADEVSLNAEGNVATFTFNSTPVTAQGPQIMQIDGGSIDRLDQPGGTILEFTGTFYFDLTPLEIAATTPSNGDTLDLPGPYTLEIEFNEPVDPLSIQTSDLVLSGIAGAQITGVTLINGDTVAQYTLEVPAEGTLSIDIAAGVFADSFGSANTVPFSMDLFFDSTVGVFPLPLSPKSPLGSLVYDTSVAGAIAGQDDADSFTIALDGGQTLTILADAGESTLRAEVRILDSSSNVVASATASSSGQNVLLGPITISEPGLYTVSIEGVNSTQGSYTLEATLNAALEAENVLGTSNNGPASAQNVNTAFVTQSTGVSHAAVLGHVEDSGGFVTHIYDLNNSYADALGGPSMVPNGGTLGASGYTFTAGEGPNLSNAISAATYSIEMSFRITSTTGFKKLIDFANRTVDGGLYNSNGALRLFPDTELSTTVITANQDVHLVVTRNDATKLFTAYVNGIERFEIADTDDVAVFSAANNIIHFFLDDTLFGGLESPGGFLDRLRIYEGVLTSAQAASLFAGGTPPAAPKDWYRFDVSAGEKVSVVISSLSGGTLDVNLANPSGVTIATAVAGPSNVDKVINSFSIPSSGSYRISVSGTAGTDYNLVVLRNAVFDAESNNSFATAQNVTSAHGMLGHLSGEDWYTFEVTSLTHLLRVESQTPGDGPDQFVNALNPHIELYSPVGPNGTLVASGTTSADGHNEYIEYLPAMTGTFRLRVVGESASTGEYLVSKNFVPTLSGVSVTSIVNEGGTATVSGTINDPDTDDAHMVVISWGPGQADTTVNLAAGETTFNIEHQYADDDPTGTDHDYYPVGVTVTDGFGGSATSAATIRVNNAAPIISALSPPSEIERPDNFVLTGTFVDFGTLDTHTVVIDWGSGPGQPPEGTTTLTSAGPNPSGTTLTHLGNGIWTFSASHRYDNANATGTASQVYIVGVSITDDDGGATASNTTVTVRNVITVSIPLLGPVFPGTSVVVPVVLEVPSDPGHAQLSSAAFAISYDTSVFTLSAGDVQLGPSLTPDWLVSTELQPSVGQLGVTLSRTTPTPVSSGNILLITFHVKSDAAVGLSRFDLAASNNPNGTGVSTALATAGSAFILRPTPTNATNDSVDGSAVVTAPVQFVFATPSSVTAGEEFSYAITALDSEGNTAEGYSGTIHFTTTDSVSELPGDATLTNGVGSFVSTLKSAGSHTITAADSAISSVIETSDPISVIAAPALSLIISGPSSTVAGGPILFSITARDEFNNLASGYSGTFQFSSSDGQSNLPGEGTLVGGVGFFAGILRTSGPQTVTVTDTVTPTLSGLTNPIMVSAAAAKHLILSAPAATDLGVDFTVSVTALDAFQNLASGYSGTVHFTTSDGAAVLPPNSTLAGGSGTFSVALKTPGLQSLSASDTVQGNIADSAAISVTQGPLTQFAISGPTTMTAGGIAVFQVSALDQFNHLVTSYGGQVAISVTDSQALLPASATLNGGVGYFAAILRGAGAHLITAIDTSTPAITGTSHFIGVSPAAAHHFGIGVPAGSVTGQSFNFTVTAFDAFQNIVTDHEGTVQFSSSDAFAALPGIYSFVPADQGVRAFSATLNTSGAHTLLASGASQSGPVITGVSPAIAARGLLVTQITPTLTGFTARFNKPLDESTINIYDTLGIFGPADVQLANNAIQTMTFSPSLANNSTFSLSFSGVSTAPITYVNTSPAVLQTNIQNALNSLANLGSGNTLVTALSSTKVTIAFQNSRGFQPVAPLGSSLGAPTISITTSTPGSSLVRGTVLLDEDQQGFTWIRSGAGTGGLLPANDYRVTLRGGVGGFVEPSGAALDGNNDGVTGDDFVTTFSVSSTPTTFLGIPDFARGPDSLYPVRVPSNAGQETQIISFSGTPHGSTFTLDFNGETTSAITYSTVAGQLQASIQAALNSLATIDNSRRLGTQVTVTNATSASVVFQNMMGGFNQPQMTTDTPTVSIATTVQGVATGIPVTLAGGVGITDIFFELAYDPDLLTIAGAYSIGDGSSLVLVGSPASGIATFHFSLGVAPPLVASETLGHIIAFVPDAAADHYKAKHVLRLQNILADGGAFSVAGNDALHVVAYLGDASGDGVISGGDAGLVSRVSTSMDSGLPGSNIIGGFGAYRLLDPDILGDLNSNGTADSSDVTLLNSYLVRSQPQVPTPPTNLTITPAGADPTLSIPSALRAEPGETITVPIYLDKARPENSPGLNSALLALRFDPRVFTVSPADILPGSLITDHFATAAGNNATWQLRSLVNIDTGEIGIDLYTSSPITNRGGGSLAYVTLHVREDAQEGNWAINLVSQVNPTGQRLFRTTLADAVAPYILFPAITDGFDPGVDGWVSVTPNPVSISSLPGPSPAQTSQAYEERTIGSVVDLFGRALFAEPIAMMLLTVQDPAKAEAMERVFAEIGGKDMLLADAFFGDTSDEPSSRSENESDQSTFAPLKFDVDDNWRTDASTPRPWSKSRRVRILPEEIESSEDETDATESHL